MGVHTRPARTESYKHRVNLHAHPMSAISASGEELAPRLVGPFSGDALAACFVTS